VLLCLYVSRCELHCVHDILSCLSVSYFGSEYQEGFFVSSCELSYLVTVNPLSIIHLCIIFLQVLFTPSGTINCPY